MFVYQMNSRRNLRADTEGHHAAGHRTVPRLTNSKFFVLLLNITNYITTNNQIIDIIMPSLPTNHLVKFYFLLHLQIISMYFSNVRIFPSDQQNPSSETTTH